MAKARKTLKGNVKLTLNPGEARMLRDIMSGVSGSGPRWAVIDALDSVGYHYREQQYLSTGRINLMGEY
jgi:hypothetical protein